MMVTFRPCCPREQGQFYEHAKNAVAEDVGQLLQNMFGRRALVAPFLYRSDIMRRFV